MASKIDWYEKLSAAVANGWFTFVQSLRALQKFKFPRFDLLEDSEEILHLGFRDVSEKGFVAVSYTINGDKYGFARMSGYLVANESLVLLSLNELEKAELWILQRVQSTLQQRV
ncbi:hypothetical protein NPIL_311701 [Nephila pilipes]|uniref:Uncharacterized protein n=1 Tax=Nephila pilipes TaxID=299642 RepID=A0A8X6NQ82_NEPPI|nr:hypothetical protein NPIL_311701 [Nephila pilipes]